MSESSGRDIYGDGWIDLNKNGSRDPYEDPAVDVEARIADLLARMALEGAGDSPDRFRDFCAGERRLSFIDVNPALFDAQGDARLELYQRDQLHFKAAAYESFTAIIKPKLVEAWLQVPAAPQTAPMPPG